LIEKNTVPTLVGGTNYKLPSEDNNYMYLARTNDNIQASAMGNFIIGNGDTKKVGIMYSSDDFGQGGFEVISGLLEEAGIEFVGEPHNTLDTDYYSTLLKMQSAGCDALVVWTGATPAPIIIRQINELALNSEMEIYFAQCLGSSAVHSALESTDLLDGMYTVQETFLDTNNEEMVAFAELCEERGVYASDAATRNYINVAQFMMNVLERAEDPTDRESVKASLEATKDQALMFGTFTCDEYNMVNHSAAICQWQKDLNGMTLIQSIQG
jgi:ABC-type branched-subunit amino acid transport system substrate-binding protein